AAKAMLTGSKRRGSGDRGARERAREAIAGAPLGRIVGMQPGQGPGGVRALELSKDAGTNGPLGHFLEATGGARQQTPGHGELHVINIRDWHVPGPAYDLERRLYGAHCEKGTWGAGYIDGLEKWLDPRGSALDEEATYFSAGSVSVYHIHSDSVF